jgi:hypothetical protein
MIHHHPYMILLQWIMIHTHFSYFETFFHQPMNYFLYCDEMRARTNSSLGNDSGPAFIAIQY